MRKTKTPLDLTTCNITSGLIRFSLPFLASSILQTLYSTVDTIIVGQFVGSAGPAGQKMRRASTEPWEQPSPSARSWQW